MSPPFPITRSVVKATLDFQSGTNEFDVIDYFYTYKGQLAEDGVIDDVTDPDRARQGEINPADFIQTHL